MESYTYDLYKMYHGYNLDGFSMIRRGDLSACLVLQTDPGPQWDLHLDSQIQRETHEALADDWLKLLYDKT
jgi:hypothetical protein